VSEEVVIIKKFMD